MIDADKLLKGLMKGGGKLAKGKLGGSKLSGGTLAKGGGLMLLGGIAYAAFEHYTKDRNQPSAGSGHFGHNPPRHMPPSMAQPMGRSMGSVSPPPPPIPQAVQPSMAPPPPPASARPEPEVSDPKAMLLVKAMIAAAKADGAVDEDERAAILSALDEQGQGAEAHAFIGAELLKPLDLCEITSQVRDAQTAAEVYTASLLAITVDTDAERQYLQQLAARLGLTPEQCRAIEARCSELGGASD